MVEIIENDIVIVGAYRTPIGKAVRGKLSTVKNDMLVYYALNGTLNKLELKPEMIDEICLGHVLSPMNGTAAAKMGVLRCNIPVSTPICTINRQCASGLDSLDYISNKLKLGEIEIGIAGGFESMTQHKLPVHDLTLFENDSEQVKGSLMPLGDTAEFLAEKYSVGRSKSDCYASLSQERAFRATKEGKFLNEILPIKFNDCIVESDDGIRPSTVDKLRTLKPAFKEDGVCTAGNSSQLSDGAAMVVMMKRNKARELGMKILGTFVDFVVVGVDPRLMGEGPVHAIRKLLKKRNMNINDINYFEINEAFSPQIVHCIEELGLDCEKVNKYGGSIALGHPVGATGARLVATLLNVMNNENISGYGIVSLCVGSGYGVAALIKKE